jgi:glutathione peroxidase
MECYQMNFNKFLINKNGSAVLRFAPTAAPSSLEKYIVDELNI